MPEKSDNPLNFWQELKRRKVVRVITVYAAAAFVILELVDIVSPALGLPPWTLAFVIVLLCIGFIISIILSWVYDITPEGVRKTQPVSKVTDDQEEKPVKKMGWKISMIVSIIIIIGLLAINIISIRKKTETGISDEKSIAVIPFKSLSDDPEKQYLADGVMDAILIHLSKIEDLRVMSRTSVEQYRTTSKTAALIGEELGVAYLLEGSFQKYEDKARLTVQLIRTKDDSHVWSNEYDRNWKNIFSVQSEVAMNIATKLKAVIKPQEMQIIESVPTSNLTAYDCFLRALEEHYKYRKNDRDKSALNRAILLYQLTLEYDSSYAKAYTGLAKAYKDKYYNTTYFEEDFLDSTLALAKIALTYDNKLEEAYDIRGDYYSDYGMYEKAIKEYQTVIRFNPNYSKAYLSLAGVYQDMGDYVKYFENYQKAIKLIQGEGLPELLRNLGITFFQLQMDSLADVYLDEALRLDDDLEVHKRVLENLESRNYKRGKVIFSEQLAKIDSILKIDSTRINEFIWTLAYANSVLGNDNEAFHYWSEYAQDSKDRGLQTITVSHRIGYAYLKAGYEDIAENYFDTHVHYCKESINLNRPYEHYGGAYYDLAGYYAVIGDNDSAYLYLDKFVNNQGFFVRVWFWWMTFDPMLNNIRDEERFKNLIYLMERKNQKERKRVEDWLKDNDLL